MTHERLEKTDCHSYEDHAATQKDLKITSLEIEGKILNLKIELENKINLLKFELENKINSITLKLGTLIIASSGILFGLLSYFHK
jgi:hypothetical protein